MNKTELVKKIADQTGLTERDTERTIDAALKLITQTIKAGEEVMLTGFGVFSSRLRHARNGVNPANPSQKIHIPELRVPKFKAGKALKDALKGKGESAPKPEEKIEPIEPEPTEPVQTGEPKESEESKESDEQKESEASTEE